MLKGWLPFMLNRAFTMCCQLLSGRGGASPPWLAVRPIVRGSTSPPSRRPIPGAANQVDAHHDAPRPSPLLTGIRRRDGGWAGHGLYASARAAGSIHHPRGGTMSARAPHLRANDAVFPALARLETIT